MAEIYANDFAEILDILARNTELRRAVERLTDTEAMPGKVTEGGDRLRRFRQMLKELINGGLTLEEAYARTERDLPRADSPYAHDNRVFPEDWGERLVRTQLSRCYNQAVMEQLLSEGAAECFVPHSSLEDSDTPCSRQLAGHNHDLRTLYERLVRAYREGVWTDEIKIPNHPHCTHTVTPRK